MSSCPPRAAHMSGVRPLLSERSTSACTSAASSALTTSKYPRRAAWGVSPLSARPLMSVPSSSAATASASFSCAASMRSTKDMETGAWRGEEHLGSVGAGRSGDVCPGVAPLEVIRAWHGLRC
jgi:hypothetical protein